ncbi:MAG: LacI family transcriptional regulator [Cellulomonas sp.]|uniref:LacI family DNA-binding transcriptional regulator n=1 Tax=Cellulomonas sp. TaxID=40001 RepID=UPI0017DB4593|nr:LacI family DNA-binding transcriptional regulator [Cellulomonas sp.]NMM16295.1 LacI family transcriptional regulator [Cellulomonas sp.]NMM31495.1 LacI family transcriptional regulator [Cellulomonas sp.]
MPGVTSADVARESGVSRTTVSYVLNAKEGVVISEATRQRVRAAALHLGYSPSAAARTLRRGKSDLVLCVLPNWPIGPVIDTLLDHLARQLAERGLSVLVHHGRGTQPLSELWRAVTPRAVVGFTAFAPQDERSMRQAGIQVVGTALEEDPRDPVVHSVSQTGIGRLQVQHLAARGHRMIAYAAAIDPRLADFTEGRLAGVRLECADRGFPEPLVTPVELEVLSAALAVQDWRAADPPVTAVAAYNDEVALAVLAGLRGEGLSVPSDVAVIGVDDIPAARLSLPALTTVSQGVDAQARYLASAVLAALDGHTDPPTFPADILDVVVRDST